MLVKLMITKQNFQAGRAQDVLVKKFAGHRAVPNVEITCRRRRSGGLTG